jgi:asparagine synthase (glutamine-hydrolysing)
MCGLIFVLERGRPVAEARLSAALGSLRHRGPDHCDQLAFLQTYQHPQGPRNIGVGIGHNRLAIIDPSIRSNQPLRTRGRCLVYNGEIYNFRELRARLARSGCRFASVGDAEVLLELLSFDGIEGLRQANGMWAFCYLDETTGKLTAARDRYGKKPLYYYADSRTICLASEIKAIFVYLGSRPEFERVALDTYLRHGWLFPGPGAATHCKNIRRVEPGGCLTVDLAAWSIEQRIYLDLSEEARVGEPKAGDLKGLLRDAVLTRLISDRPIGLLLSGGVDSSLILSVLAACRRSEQVRCFVGDAGKSEDADYAHRCVRALGIRAEIVQLDYEATGFDRFLKVCAHQEKPFPFIGNVLAMPQMYEQIAQAGVAVVLDGTGGDEVFAGYWDRYWHFAAAQAVRADDERWLAATRTAGLANHDSSDAASALAYLRAYCSSEVFDAPTSDPLDRLEASLTEALVIDATRGRMQEWLWQNDRNSMLAGTENRSPFLDYRLLPFIKTGYAAKFVGPWNKYELRALFNAFVPLPTQWRRQKQGFRWVFGRFLRHNRAKVAHLIASSSIVRERVNLNAYLKALTGSDSCLESDLTQRLLCLAGLEAAMGAK